MIEKRCSLEVDPGLGGMFQIVHPGYDEGPRLVKQGEASGPAQEQLRAFLRSLSPTPGNVYSLISALGAGEYWGSNSNGDWFGEAALVHIPEGWHGMSHRMQKAMGAKWEWGYPTFYNANVFQHHRNQDPRKAFGSIEYVYWDPIMKRVLLVCSFNRAKARQEGAEGVIDKIENGEFPSVSMGARVPFDLCVPAGTLVLTEDGHVPVEWVEAGVYVRSHTGRLRRVVRTFQRTANELVRLRATGMGDALVCTPNHPVHVIPVDQPRSCSGSANGKKRRHNLDARGECACCKRALEYTPEWRAAEDLQFGDYLLTPIRQSEPNDPPGGWAYARTVGYYIGDGSRIRQRRGRKKDGPYQLRGLQFSARLDEDHIERVMGALYQLSGKEPRRYAEGYDRQAVSLRLYDQDLAARVVESCGTQGKSKRIPEECFGWSEALRLELLGALIDTDGSFDECKQSARYTTTSPELALDLVDLCFSLGIPASSRHNASTGGYGGGTVYYSIFLPKEHSRKLERYSERVAQKIHPPEKNEKSSGSAIFFWNGYACAPVVELEREELDEPVEVFNFEVDQDESYIAQGIAVHNCSICTDWSRITGNFRRDLAEHKKKAIRGLSVTTRDYCQHLMFERGRIYPDGRKVFMWNLHPRFFDLSVVFIGADKTSYVLAKLAGRCPIRPEKQQCRGGCRDCAFGSSRSLSF